MNTRITICLTLLLSFFCKADELVTLRYGETLSVPDGAVACFQSAYYTYASDTDANDQPITEVSRLKIFGTINNEVIKIPPINLPFVVPVLHAGPGGLGSLLGGDAGSNDKRLTVSGPIELRMGVYDQNGSPISMKADFCAELIVLMKQGTTSSAVPAIPQCAVVVPSDSTGPVEIKLESSVDLVSWNSATPGLYGASTEKRFFRVRAVTNTD